jgi:hypothetical protein
MGARVNYWTKEEETKLLAAVTKAPSVPAAVDAARIALPSRGLNVDVISKKLKRMGHPPLSDLVAKPCVNKPPPERTVHEDLREHRLLGKLAELESRNKRLLSEVATKDDELANFKALSRAPRPIVATKSPDDKQRKAVPVLLKIEKGDA